MALINWTGKVVKPLKNVLCYLKGRGPLKKANFPWTQCIWRTREVTYVIIDCCANKSSDRKREGDRERWKMDEDLWCRRRSREIEIEGKWDIGNVSKIIICSSLFYELYIHFFTSFSDKHIPYYSVYSKWVTFLSHGRIGLIKYVLTCLQTTRTTSS